MMPRAAALFLLLALAVLHAVPVRADGTLPPLPYRYLHPPPALAGTNNLPLSITVPLPVQGHTSAASNVFTRDGQAGIIAPTGAFAVPAGARSVNVTVKPVDTPPNLPAPYAGDGNAYSISAVARPGSTVPGLASKVALVLRWPHIPTAIEVFTHGSWKQVCYSNNAILTPSTISCRTKTLGIFTAVALPSSGGLPSALPRPAPTGLAAISRYIPFIAAGIVVLVAIILGYILSRPDRRT